MGLFSRKSPPAKLSAASSPVQQVHGVDAQVLSAESLRVRGEVWQRRVLELHDLVPEVAGAASLVSNNASQVRLVVEGSGLRADQLDDLLSSLDVGRAIRLDFLVGEYFLVQLPEAGLEVFSPAEFRVKDGKAEMAGANGSFSAVPVGTRFWRVWNPSPLNRWRATSPHRAALDLVESMFIHQLADSAVATSRLAGAGILFWPTTAQRRGLDDNGNPFPDSQEALMKQYTDAAVQSITKRNSKGATIPFVVFYDPSDGDYKPELLRIDRDDHADQYAARFESYRLRYATAIELPIEQVTGMGATNHWSAWAIREDGVRSYLSPMMYRLLDALNTRLAEPNGLSIALDFSALTAKPDNTPTIMQLLQLGVIDEKYAFDELGFDPSQSRPTPQTEYSSNVVKSAPSDFKVGGERGGGRYADGRPTV